MKSKTLFWILVLAVIVLGLSSFFSWRLIQNDGSKNNKTLIIEAAPLVNLQNPTVQGSQEDAEGPKTVHNCTLGVEFTRLRQELGKIVNTSGFRHNVAKFLKDINAFRKKNGLPLPLAVTPEKLEAAGAVYNNCRSTCGGNVHEVFVSKIVGDQFVEVKTKGGPLKKLKFREGGLEVASVDELNRKGIPFRSWLAPVSENDWYIRGQDLYYSLDIEGLWLRIDPYASRWQVVPSPRGLIKLKKPDEPLSIPGCNLDEQCFVGASRHFKAPRICQKAREVL